MPVWLSSLFPAVPIVLTWELTMTVAVSILVLYVFQGATKESTPQMMNFSFFLVVWPKFHWMQKASLTKFCLYLNRAPTDTAVDLIVYVINRIWPKTKD